MRTEGLQDSRSAESSGSNGVGRKCLGRVKWLGLVCARGWYPSTSARHTRPQHELALLLPSIPILLCCDTPLLVPFSFLCYIQRYCIYPPTHCRHNKHHLSAPTASTLPHSDAVHSNVPPTRHRTAHPGTSASLPVHASHQAPDEKTRPRH